MSASNAGIRPASALIRTTIDLFFGPLVIAAALLYSVFFPVPVMAQTLTSSGISWNTASNGPTTATISNGALAVAIPLAVSVAYLGLTRLNPVVATVSTAASVVGPIAAGMLRTAQVAGKLSGPMLALALAMAVANVSYDPGGNTFTVPDSTATQVGTQTGKWTRYGQSSPTFDTAQQACTYLSSQPPYNTFPNSPFTLDAHGASDTIVSCGGQFSLQGPVTTCPAGATSLGGGLCTNPAATKPATDAQLAAGASSSAALPYVWPAASDTDKKNIIAGGTPGPATFPGGTGGSFPPDVVSGPNTDPQGRPFNGTVSTVPGYTLSANTGSDFATNPVAVTPTQTRTWTGTDVNNNPVNVTQVSSGTPQTVPTTQQAPAGASSAAAAPVQTCGLPGKPKCLIDETGTPTTGDFSKPQSDLAAARADAVTQMQNSTKQSSFGLSLPTLLPGGSCSPIEFFHWKDFSGTVDLCQRLGFIRTLLGWLWGAGGAIYIYNRVSSANA